MLNIVLFFYVHRAYRLKKFSVFDIGKVIEPFDTEINRSTIERCAKKCYIPATTFLLQLAERFGAKFRFSMSISGTAVELLSRFSPAAMDLFLRIAEKGCVEYIGETYYRSISGYFKNGHSINGIYDSEEFMSQIHLHLLLLGRKFGTVPLVFWCTGTFDERIAGAVGNFKNIRVLLLEEAGSLYPCQTKNGRFCLLLKNHTFSDEIARLCEGKINTTSVLAEELVDRLDSLCAGRKREEDLYLNLFLDYDILKERSFPFFEKLSYLVSNHPTMRFSWPSEAMRCHGDNLSAYSTSYSADSGGWLNDLQRNAVKTTFYLLNRVKSFGTTELLETVRRLTSVDHFYRMDERYNDSPEDAYLSFMHTLADIEEKLSR
jgi:alpha-amylase